MDIDKLRQEIARRAAAYEDTHKTADGGGAAPQADGTGIPAGAGGSAQSFYRRLFARVQRMEARLKPTERIELTHDVPDGHCYVEQVGYDGDDMLAFTGHLASGHRCTVLVHVHAVNLCITVAPLAAGEARTRIAFREDAQQDE